MGKCWRIHRYLRRSRQPLARLARPVERGSGREDDREGE